MSKSIENNNNIKSTEVLPQVKSNDDVKIEKTIEVTSLTFPNKNKLKSLIFESNFNKFINLLKSRMISAISLNQTFVLIKNIDIESNTLITFSDVKKFLVEKCYIINELEDVTGNRVGWRISWGDAKDDHSFANPIKFDEQTELTRETFPKSHLLKRFSYQNHFNKILNVIKNQMIDAINSKQPSVRISKADLNSDTDTIDELKTFLLEQEYTVYDVIDHTNVFVGIRILWDDIGSK